MKLAPFRAVIFDCDGVLVESEMLGLRSLQQALREAGIERSLDELTRFSGRSHHETLSELSAESGVALGEVKVTARMDALYMEIVEREGLPTCKGIPELLQELSSRGIPFTLASSGPRSKVTFSLKNGGLSAAFQNFVCGDDVKRAKPEPDIYLAAAALLGVPPAECLAIEDAPNGVRAAVAAGMQVLGVATTFPANALVEAHLVLPSVAELALPKADEGAATRG